MNPADRTRSRMQGLPFQKAQPSSQAHLSVSIPGRLGRTPQHQGLAQALSKSRVISLWHAKHFLPQLDTSKLGQYSVIQLRILEAYLLMEHLLPVMRELLQT